MSMVSRRGFVQGASLAGLGMLAGCGQWLRPAQAPARVPHIGYLTPGDTDAIFETALSQGLREVLLQRAG